MRRDSAAEKVPRRRKARRTTDDAVVRYRDIQAPAETSHCAQYVGLSAAHGCYASTFRYLNVFIRI